LRPNLTLNLSYQYVDLGSTSLAASSPGGVLSQNVNARGQFQVVSAGASWLFPAPVAAGKNMPTKALPPVALAPWQGFYVGGHGGGAWGNRTDARYFDNSAF